MTTEIRVPTLGESLTTATLARWAKKPGDYAFAGDIIAELETEKVNIEVSAPVSGRLMAETILLAEGQEVEIGQVLCALDEQAASPPPPSTPESAPESTPRSMPENTPQSVMPSLVTEKEEFPGTYQEKKVEAGDGVRREKMNRLRQTIARNLKQAQNTAAILTTFNEIDMTEVKALRTTYKEMFEKRHDGVRLGFMSFFARAVVEALRAFPIVNAHIEGDEIVYQDHVNLGIAVGTERGLVVPVLHHAEAMSFAALESQIADYGKRARAGRLQLSELAGGSFTITNGGIFGSLLSTPILNAPQSGVLGIHAIQDRPVARNGEVVIRPMMYVALSYDHRLVDGREAVSFLVRVKELVEDPRRLLLGL